ncbi:MAG: response regulator [Pleurocapsa minor GSE-CHR-MK-17-07R]|jgi:class 3 adenylate cyclase|nr:response regulator [Pleurocapsa minor GSE-CHR-MK 17-07R]
MLVLVVDDVNDSRQLLVDIVGAMGMRVVQAANGPDTLSIARQAHPDLILLDVNMPGMSGFQVLEALKADPNTAGIPIIMLTALADIDSRVKGLKLGADDYLAKPYNPRELMERVRTRLRSKQATDEMRAVQAAIRETFERYVAPAVVEQLLRDPTQVKLGGTLQEITVLFLDLEGFTSLSERTEPERLLAILNQYHTLAVNCVRENGGTVDKFLGDGLMALYNTPLTQPDHALRAVRTALQLQEAVNQFHAQFLPDERMKLSAGIHTGPAVVGNVGAPDLMNYTAVGDTVNLAARLEEMSSGGIVLISQATLDQLPPTVKAEPIGAQKVKGRAGDVMTYRVISES